MAEVARDETGAEGEVEVAGLVCDVDLRVTGGQRSCCPAGKAMSKGSWLEATRKPNRIAPLLLGDHPTSTQERMERG
jgi:hypothetical protein